jgi:hypothetical protein
MLQVGIFWLFEKVLKIILLNSYRKITKKVLYILNYIKKDKNNLYYEDQWGKHTGFIFLDKEYKNLEAFAAYYYNY